MHLPKRLSPHTAGRSLAWALAAVALLAAPALEAQQHRGAFTVLGGGSAHDDFTPWAGTRTVLDAGWVTGLQLERWIGGGRVGARLGTLYTQRTLDNGPGDYNIFAADLGLLFRPLRVSPDRSVTPYLTLGAGASAYGAVAGSPPFGGGAYGGDPVFRAHTLVGLGLDLRVGRRLGIRLEAADPIVLPSVGESPPSNGLPTVHGVLLMAGLQVRFGLPASPVEPAVLTGPAEAVPVEERRLAADPDRAATPLYTVQVGSFVEAATAQRWAERLRRQALPVWLIDTHIQGEPVSRVRVGALESESEAHGLAAALEREYGWPVWVDQVGPDEAIPADAVLATRQFLFGR